MKKTWKTPVILWTLGASLLGLGGCADVSGLDEVDESGAALEDMPVEIGEDADTADQTAPVGRVLEEIATEGGTLRFIDEGDGTIGVLEVGGDERFALSQIDRPEGLTSLEIFQTLAPERVAPVELLDAHPLEAAALDRADLDVHPAIMAFGFDDQTGQQDYTACRRAYVGDPSGPYSHDWVFNRSWGADFSGLEVEESKVLTDLDTTAGYAYFYAGSGAVRRVYLGVCVGDKWDGSWNSTQDDLDFMVQRRSTTSTGSWTNVIEYHLDEDERAVYYTAWTYNNRYRGRMRATFSPGGAQNYIRHVGFGVAYDKPLGFGISL